MMIYKYFAFVRCKLGYGSVAWNYVTITHSNKLDRIQRKFAALSHSRDLKMFNITITIFWEKNNLQILHVTR
jgi:hypothetical protein